MTIYWTSRSNSVCMRMVVLYRLQILGLEDGFYWTTTSPLWPSLSCTCWLCGWDQSTWRIDSHTPAEHCWCRITSAWRFCLSTCSMRWACHKEDVFIWRGHIIRIQRWSTVRTYSEFRFPDPVQKEHLLKLDRPCLHVAENDWVVRNLPIIVRYYYSWTPEKTYKKFDTFQCGLFSVSIQLWFLHTFPCSRKKGLV